MLKKFFELDKSYQFDINDVVAFVYVICAIFGSIGFNVTPLFLIGSIIATTVCWKARKLNLIALNVALFGLNVVNFIKMF